MSSTPVSGISQTRVARPQQWIQPAAWVWIALLTLAFCLLFWPFLQRMILIATSGFTRINPDWGHIVVIPVISLFFVYSQRDQLRRAPMSIGLLGLPIFAVGVLGFNLGISPVRNDMFQGVFMVVALFGLVLLLVGPRMMRYLWFPIVYLLFMIKISDRVWELVAYKMQDLAALGATKVLSVIAGLGNFDVASRGSTIDLSFMDHGVWVTESLNVIEACAGLRMLMAFIALGVAVAFMWFPMRPDISGRRPYRDLFLDVLLLGCDRHSWQRLILIGMTLPIAVAVNIGRVTVIGVLYTYNRELAQGAFHTFVGMLMLIPGLLLFVGLAWVLENILIDDGQKKKTPPQAAPPEAALPQAASPQAVRRDMASGTSLDAPLFENNDNQAPAKPLGKRGLVAAGVAVGAVLMIGVGLIYLGLLAVLRPELLAPAEQIGPAGMSLAVLAVATGLAVLLWRLPRWLERWSGGAVVRRYSVVLGMAMALLVVGWVDQQAMLAATKIVLIRKPVPLALPLYEVPAEVGPWRLVSEQPPLSEEIQAELGTDKYFTRTYEDRSLPEGSPGRMMQLHVAYYTGRVDTVPHVPDRCMLAGGVTYEGLELAPLSLHVNDAVDDPETGGLLAPAQLKPQVRLPAKEFSATLFSFAMPSRDGASQKQESSVVYFFLVNGRTLATPELVRLQGFDIRDAYGYYCKVEMRWEDVGDPKLAIQRSEDFLSYMLPEIMACIADWQDVKAGKLPAPAK